MYNKHVNSEQEPNKAETLSPALTEIIKPQQTAIIVVDVMDAYFNQNAVLPRLVNSDTTKLDATAKKIKAFLEATRKYPLAAYVFTKMVERPDAMPANYAYKMEEVDDTPPLVEVEGSGWDYYEVQPQEDDHQVTKNHYNAFSDTNLDDYLKSKGVKSLVIVGGYGSRCVASTAVVAADVYGYHVFVPRDLIANLDSSEKPYEGEWVDEIPGFLQALDAIWGYAPTSQAILNTWQQLSDK